MLPPRDENPAGPMLAFEHEKVARTLAEEVDVCRSWRCTSQPIEVLKGVNP